MALRGRGAETCVAAILFPSDCALKPRGWGDPNNVRHRIELKSVREDYEQFHWCT